MLAERFGRWAALGFAVLGGFLVGGFVQGQPVRTSAFQGALAAIEEPRCPEPVECPACPSPTGSDFPTAPAYLEGNALLLSMHLGTEAVVEFVETRKQDICSGEADVRHFQDRYLRHMAKAFD